MSQTINKNLNSTKKRRIFYLDFVRSMATIFIVIHHFNTTLAEQNIITNNIFLPRIGYTNMGRLGVSLFFIISGAALWFTYEGKFNYSQYFKNRFLSIYPLYWLTYTCGFLYLFYTTEKIKRIAAWRFVYTFFGLDGYLGKVTPTFYILGEWFLGCIILLYLFFPVLRYGILKRPIITITSVVIIYLSLILFYPSTASIIAERNFLIRLLEFTMGMYFVKFIRELQWWKAGLSCIVFVLTLFYKIETPSITMLIITITGTSLFVVLVFIGQRINSNVVKRICQCVCKYSFSVFLVHHLVEREIIRKFSGLTLSNIETATLFLLCILFISIISKLVYSLYKLVIEKVQLIHQHIKTEV